MTSGPIFPGPDQGPAGLAGPAGLDPGQQGQPGQIWSRGQTEETKAGPKKVASKKVYFYAVLMRKCHLFEATWRKK